MSPERWRQIEEFYNAARDRHPDERAAFLAEVCAGDEAMRLEVESLLSYQPQAEGFMESPVRDVIIGTKLAHYEITSHLGSGGMGDVYQATDKKLGRSVAIKLLPDAFRHDRERAARFEREARLLASLNHVNIAAIHGIEENSGQKFLVMELVPGDTLAERIKRGPIPLDEALPIARQIADALEAAHEKGTIHRDLKPANIKVTPQGQVKVLDFGLAKAFAGEAAEGNLSDSPILSMASTKAGVILGTAAYMSPEQARGRVLDSRSDIWSFGVVLYEMLAGKRPFTGETVSETMAEVMMKAPDLNALPITTPSRLCDLVRRCLVKDPRKRLRDIGDARLSIEDLESEPARAMPAAPARTLKWIWVTFAFTVIAVAGFAIPALRYVRGTSPPEMRTDIVTLPTLDPMSFALSPDGSKLLFVASRDGQSRLWLRPLDSATAQPLSGTENASYPFWSSDSRSVGFFAGGKLKRMDIGGGSPQTLADAGTPRGGAWSSEGVILFGGRNGGLWRVPATSGDTVSATQAEAGQTGHRFPQFLPGGRQFLFFALAPGSPDLQGIFLGSLDDSKVERLTASNAAGLYVPGWLVYIRQDMLVARRFDIERRVLTGDPVTISDRVGMNSGVSIGAFSVSAAGLIAYRPDGESRRQLTWFDRSGKITGTFGERDADLDLGLSPDGRRVAVRRGGDNTDIYIIDDDGRSRFTFDPTPEVGPLWSPDGTQILFRSTQKGLYRKPANGAGSEELLVEWQPGLIANDWSLDGRFILYSTSDPKTKSDLWVLPQDGDRKPRVFVNGNADEQFAQFSANGRWVAYQSNESGREQIYIRPFAGPGGPWQVSAEGGIWPRWRDDGEELNFIAPDGQLMAAPIVVQGEAVEPGPPVALFQTRIIGGGALIGVGPQYDVAPDGRFLINAIVEDAFPITLLQNWKAPVK